MPVPRLAVVISLLLSMGSLSWSLLSTPPMQAEISRDAFGTIAAVAFGALFCSWPWFAAYSAAGKQSGYACAMVYAIGSLPVSLGFAAALSGAPTEGIGWNVILCTVVLWSLYLFASRLKGEPGARNRAS